MGKLYIAYGSNLNLAQMAVRCPAAVVYARGILPDWELVYRGQMMNSHATIRKKKGSAVPVLVWDIQAHDELRLDRYEGFPGYYYKQDIIADIGDRRIKAMAYIMNQKEKPGQPSEQYIETIRQGYIDNCFPLDLFEKTLEENSIECSQKT